MLSDVDIREALSMGHIAVRPTPLRQAFQPASLDLTLDGHQGALVPSLRGAGVVVSLDDPPKMIKEEFVAETGTDRLVYDIAPGEFVLMSTTEHVSLSPRIAARVEGRSSMGRLGLTAHITAGFIDPGFRGNITLELANHGPYLVRVWGGMRVAQLCFFQLITDAERPYGHLDLGSKYQDQRGVQSVKKERA